MTFALRNAQVPYANTVIAKPSGTVSGDLLVVIQGISDTTSTGTAPSGWTEIVGARIVDTPSATQFRYWWKIAGGSEPANYTFTNSAATYQDVASIGFSGTPNAAPVDVAGVGTFASGATGMTYPALTTTVAGDVVLGVTAGNPTNVPASPLSTVASGSWDGNDIAYAVLGAAGSTGTTLHEAFSAATTYTGPFAIVAFREASSSTPIAGSDTATGTQAATLSAAVPGADSASAADTGVISAASPVADAATGADASSLAASATQGDTAAASSAASLAVSLVGSDAASGADSAATAASIPASETGAGTSATAIAASSAVADSGGGVDGATVVSVNPVSAADSGGGVDGATVVISASIAGSDAASASDAATTTAVLGAGNTASGTDSAALAASIVPNDPATGADSALVGQNIPAADGASALDTATMTGIGIAASDSAHGVDAGAVSYGAMTISPASIPATSDGQKITITTAGALNTDRVWIDGQARTTVYVSATSLVAVVLRSDLAAPMTRMMKVVGADGTVRGSTSLIVSAAPTVTIPNPPWL